MLSVSELTFSYPGAARADAFGLRVPSFEVARGEHLALVGDSGCGKTTLARLIAGIEVPDAGSVGIDGTRIDQLSDAERRAFRAANIGFVFQSFELLEYLPALDNILLPYAINPRLNASGASERAKALAERLGIGTLLKRRPNKLSQGERQRVAIARALVTEPVLLLADEPTGNLDPRNTNAILELLHAEARARSATLLVITHDHGHLDGFDRVVDVSSIQASSESTA